MLGPATGHGPTTGHGLTTGYGSTTGHFFVLRLRRSRSLITVGLARSAVLAWHMIGPTLITTWKTICLHLYQRALGCAHSCVSASGTRIDQGQQSYRMTPSVERVTFLGFSFQLDYQLTTENEYKCAPHLIQPSIQLEYCSTAVLQRSTIC